MFAGIIERIGVVRRIAARAGAARESAALQLEIGADDFFAELPLGASVAVNGVCLSVVARDAAGAAFDVVPETWQVSALGQLTVGDRVNLERSLRVGDRIDGHFVQGHVDGVGTVERVDRAGDGYKLWVTMPAALAPYVVRKGSIALDGVSLTVADVERGAFAVALIPTTLSQTALSARRAGQKINIETDIIARVVVNRLAAVHGAASGVTWEQLERGGFMA